MRGRRRELGWEARTDLERGVAGYLSWLRESPVAKPAERPAEEPAREGIGKPRSASSARSWEP